MGMMEEQEKQRRRLLPILSAFDGKSVEPFRQVSAQLEKSPSSILEVLGWIDGGADSAIEVGATWVVKDLLESGATANSAAGAAVVELLGRVRAPDALLHLLQTLPALDWDSEAAEEDRLFARLEQLSGHSKTFVRAWALNALGWVAERAPRHRGRALAIFDAAEAGAKASVKVRIRKARASLEGASEK